MKTHYHVVLVTREGEAHIVGDPTGFTEQEDAVALARTFHAGMTMGIMEVVMDGPTPEERLAMVLDKKKSNLEC